MLDSDLAELYGVQTKVLVQAVKPPDPPKRPIGFVNSDDKKEAKGRARGKS